MKLIAEYITEINNRGSLYSIDLVENSISEKDYIETLQGKVVKIDNEKYLIKGVQNKIIEKNLISIIVVKELKE